MAYKFEVSPNAKEVGDYTIFTKNCLGKGKYGEVFEGKNKITQQRVAVKVSKNLGIFNEQNIQEIMNSREILVMQKVKSENLVGFYDYKITQNNVYLFIEYCDGGTLSEYMKKNPNLKDEQIVQIFQQIARGFQALVKENVIHRDLKPDNIMFHQGNIKISDFGFARFIEGNPETPQNYTLKGTPLYVPPQVFDNKKYSNQFDIWSFGCILFELTFGKNLHDKINDLGQLKNSLAKLKNTKVQFPKNDRNPQILLMISKMLEYYEETRITWPQIFESDMFIQSPENFLLGNSAFEIIGRPSEQNQNKISKLYQDKLSNIQTFAQLSEHFEKAQYDQFFLLKWKCILFYFWNFYLDRLCLQIEGKKIISSDLEQQQMDFSTFESTKILIGYLQELLKTVKNQMETFCVIAKQWIDKPNYLLNKTLNLEEINLINNIQNGENKLLIFFVEKYSAGMFPKEIDFCLKQIMKIIKDELVN